MVFVSYLEYLTTTAWRTKAYQAKHRADWRCEYCGRENVALETHHQTYARVGRERPDDLIVLCEECHEQIHKGLDTDQLRLPFSDLIH
jgi:5-methylcytosine-specific restriction endonuclease McrA